ncbi:MAG TPA: ATP-binding cassette domain-containing protein, partial [Candidatus Acidoferrales bacterium]|nr:ATP-binding cassette domain-containing protein [Candidatus Acidoferrales bacterium]
MAAVIAVRDLVKRYRKGTSNAVDGISFDVESGEFFALLGPNGAGKTTTISILTTTLSPTSGSVRIAGHDVVREASAVRGQVGIIF